MAGRYGFGPFFFRASVIYSSAVSATPQDWLLLHTGSRPAAENMAMDEALLEAAPQSGKPVLRFYGWTEPAATFGYFQSYSAVAPMTRLRPLVRRPTGGGLVPHDGDWTYSLIFPPTDPWYALKAVKSYERVHAWIRSSFAQAGVATELSAGAFGKTPGQCFAGAERFDLLWQARKIAGAAQRRNRHGLLVQGSIQPPPGVAKADWQKAFCDAAHRQWGVNWAPLEAGPALEGRASDVAQQKYSQRSYNERR